MTRGMPIAGLLLLGAALAFGGMGATMALGQELVLCSEFEGRLVDRDGRAQLGVPVTRRWVWAWGEKSGEDRTETDAEGRFRFAEVRGTSWTASIVPHSPSVKQEVIAEAPSGPVLLYSIDKHNYDRDGELLGRGIDGPGIRLTCRIDQEADGDGPFWGTCVASD